MLRLETFLLLFKSVHKKVNVFTSQLEWKKTFTFFLFLILSFAFWFFQSMQEEYETQIVVPVSFRMPAGMAFIEAPPPVVTARVRDRGSVLLNYLFKKITVNVEAGTPSGRVSQAGLSTSDIEALLLKQFSPTTNILSFSPQRIEISYGKRSQKRLPVVFDGDIVAAPGYTVSGDISFDPPLVDVSGGEVVLDTLSEIHTEYAEVKNADKTVVRKLMLRSTDGVALAPNSVSVLIPIEEYTEKTIEIGITGARVPEGYTMRMFPSSAKVTCNVPLSLFKELSANTFAVEASFAELDSLHPGVLPLKLTKKPAGIKQISLSPASIEFILEQTRQ
ncbi:MAG: YbbR-like domain-containing protein [Tannerellaceae bacterium]|jgi:hypothetical protein|nr:YbbR-like domain-containing protein [Tannerellaceae bacterium]